MLTPRVGEYFAVREERKGIVRFTKVRVTHVTDRYIQTVNSYSKVQNFLRDGTPAKKTARASRLVQLEETADYFERIALIETLLTQLRARALERLSTPKLRAIQTLMDTQDE